MNDRVVGQLFQALQQPTLHSLVLVPAEQPATLHVLPSVGGGWALSLDCRRVLSDLLRAIVANGASHAATPSTCSVLWRGHNWVRVQIETADPQVVRRLLQVLVDDHVRTRPTVRLAAIVVEEGSPTAHRVEVVSPPPPKPVRSASLRVLPVSRMATGRL